MLLLAYLTNPMQQWEKRIIRIFAHSSKDHEEHIRLDFQAMLEVDVQKLIFEHSHDTSLVFMLMKLFASSPEDYVGDSLDDYASRWWNE